MRLALALGRRGQGRTWPNPAVGCVIRRGDRIVGRGWTAPGGRPHAEPQALAQAGDLARGAVAYVSLEPCSHHGQTPPCADALIRAGVARVVIAIQDPDPRVSGRGIAMLRAAGIAVETGLCADMARQDLAGFLLRIGQGRPHLSLKLATSFDGRIATRSGHSQWITDAPARRMVHAMRARADAVMVGGGTARADDPTLTVRGLGVRRQPVRVVLSAGLDLPTDGNLARTARAVPLWLCHGADAPAARLRAWRDLGAELLPCPAGEDGRLSVAGVLQALGGRGLTRVLCEGGGGLAAALLRADLVDELTGFTAGLVIGSDGLAAVAGLGLDRLDRAPRFALHEVAAVGPDARHVWRRVSAPE